MVDHPDPTRSPPGPSRRSRSLRSRIESIVGEPVAWLASLATHAAALFLLALLTALTPLEKAPLLFSTPLPEEPEQLDEAFRVSEELSVDVGALSDGGAGDAAAAAPLEAELSDVSLDLTAVADLGDIATLDSATALLTSPDPSDNLLVRGVGAVGASGSAGAVDRLTGEILLSLEQRPTLVVWLFDRSASLTDQRAEIVERFDRVYDQLGVAAERGAEGFEGSSGKPDDEPLLTTIASFGRGVNFFTPKPTADLEEIKQAVRAITPDVDGNEDEGVENVFGAVIDSVQRHKRYRLRKPRRNVMIVVVTDEAGDDTGRADQAVDLCRKMQTPVYVIGAPAPLGRLDTYVPYRDPNPENDQFLQFLPVRQGPESLLPERLRLGFFGRGDFDGPMLDSGFGPFGLTRLTAESGGFFIAVHPFRVDHGRADKRSRGQNPFTADLDYFFDQRLMRRYRPDYVPVAEYRRRLTKNGARRALSEAAQLSWQSPQTGRLNRVFPKLEDAQFARDLSRAQRDVAILEPNLIRLVATLRQGEKDRKNLESPRWQAGYDLAMGRALATKVRAEGYNAMLALAKQGMPFTDERKDTWVITPTAEIITGSRAKAEGKEAIEYLKRVIEEHEGTPWALLAQRELDRPLGWQWRDEFRNLAERRARQQANANRPPPREAPPKPRRPPPKL